MVAALAALVILGIVVAVVAAPRPPRAEPADSLSDSSSAPSNLTASPTPPAPRNPSPTAPPSPGPTFDASARSITDPASIWVVVDKLRPLNPVGYVPADLVTVPVPYANAPTLRAEASQAIVTMFDAVTADTGLRLQSQSAYRSYNTQVSVYAGNVSRFGQERADLVSARPGFSEHQTGLVMDISSVPAVCSLDVCFAGTPEGRWLAGNAWRYGFLMRYPEGKTEITGYSFEPWHYRYVGTELAAEMHDRGILTLEEFFGLPPAPGYAG